MVKFGEYLRNNAANDWAPMYLNYAELRRIINDLEVLKFGEQESTGIGTSLSVPRPTNAAGTPIKATISQEDFFVFLENEMRKIEDFTKLKVQEIREVLQNVESQVNSLHASELAARGDTLRREVEKAGEQFLKLEKYVNLNFTGFHKILKKHDRRLPNPCRSFYLSRLHDQSWVRGDYSDVIVTMSRVYSALRGDEELEPDENAKQDFVRSTRKYWVHTEDVSRVKYIILQHLPVFLQKTMAGETDSQLVNSVYVDNFAMELYHGRLDKTPGAIALRLRWYGTGAPEVSLVSYNYHEQQPTVNHVVITEKNTMIRTDCSCDCKVVFVERKTHRESWAGDISVKERFTIQESQVLDLLSGKFSVETEMEKLKKKGKSEEEIREWESLASEVVQAVNSKQLIPTMRSQYMRTAFQIPFDATVRISLDTNLCMIAERTEDVLSGQRWYRDPNKPVPLNEITRFPHAVLEIKLQLEDENMTPPWVTELLNSGMVLEVHKFSKFIHGCAVLMPDEVVAVPYWIDDLTLIDSINKSGAAKILEKNVGANQQYKHLLPHGAKGNLVASKKEEAVVQRKVGDSHAINLEPQLKKLGNGLVPKQHAAENGEEHDEEVDTSFHWRCCDWASSWEATHLTQQKVEPKVFLANERTFIRWMEMSVTLSSISIGVLAFTKKESSAQGLAMAFLPLAVLFVIYAVRQYMWRAEKIRTRDTSRWDDMMGPVVLTSVLTLALFTQFCLTLINMVKGSTI